MASKTEAPPQKEEMLEKDPEIPPDSPLPDLSDAAVKKLIRSAKKRGYVTHVQINALLSSEEVKSEQIEDILAKFSEMGVNVVETEEAEPEDKFAREAPEEEPESGELVEVQQRSVPVKFGAKDSAEHTDDPVRMYLREMGSVELLSRAGEIAIAKRIEASREAMIAGLCESPLTFQAIIIWRDELNEGKVYLRDIIDLDATYAGPDAKAMPGPVIGPDGQLIVGIAIPGQPGRPSAATANAKKKFGGARRRPRQRIKSTIVPAWNLGASTRPRHPPHNVVLGHQLPNAGGPVCWPQLRRGNEAGTRGHPAACRFRRRASGVDGRRRHRRPDRHRRGRIAGTTTRPAQYFHRLDQQANADPAQR